MHVRQQIREAVAVLVTGLVTTQARVFSSRIYPVSADDLPCLLIYSTSEQSEVDGMGNARPLYRTLIINVEALASANTDLDDTLDTISVEVETALAADRKLGGLAITSTLAQTEITLKADGESTVGSIRLSYEIEYRTTDKNPETTT